MSQGNKNITTRKIPAANNKVLVRTGSLRFFKKYRQPIIKFWSVPVPVREKVCLLLVQFLYHQFFIYIITFTTLEYIREIFNRFIQSS